MRLMQVAIHADDLDRAATFWSSVLDAEPVARFDPPGLVFFDLDGTRLLLEESAPTSTIYLQVGDLAAFVERVRAFAQVTSEPHLIFTHEDDRLGPAGQAEWQAFLLDSEGNTVGLVSHTPT